MFKILFGNKRAESVSRLILIVTMIIVAAIAASLILNVGFSMESKAVRVARRSETFGSLSLEVVQVYAEDGRDEEGVKDFVMKVKLSPKSEPIRMDGTLLEFQLMNQSLKYTLRDINETSGETYNCSWDPDPKGSGYYNNLENNSGFFGLEYVTENSNHKEGYILSEEMVKICFRAPRYVETDEELNIFIIPKLSHHLELQLHAPNLFNTKGIYLYPSRTAG